MIANWQPKDSNVHIVIQSELRGEEQAEWIIAHLVIDGKIGGYGECPNTGVYKTESLAERTAIAKAQHQFNRKVCDCPIQHFYQPSMRINGDAA